MQKKIILFMPSIEFGGVEKNLYLLSKFLSKKLKIAIITADNLSKKKFSKDIEYISPKRNFFYKKKKYLKYMVCVILLIKQILSVKNIAVFSFQANIYAIIVCKIFNIKIITRSNTSPTGWSDNFLKIYIFKKVLRLSNLVIVNSAEFKKEMNKKFNIKSKLILNPLNKKEIIKNSKFKLRKEIFFKKDYLNIINVSRLTDQKDHITLLKAINIIKDKIKFKLLIVGDGANKSKIIDFIYLNKLHKNVKLKKYQANPYPLIKKSDLLILSSKYEGLPNILLEGITLKKFIISSNCNTGPKEILDNGRYGLIFNVGNEKELASKILMYYHNPNKYDKMKLAAYKSLNKYDFEKNCDLYYKCIKNYLF